MKICKTEEVYDTITPEEMADKLEHGKGMCVVYDNNNLDGILLCQTHESKSKQILCFQSFSKRNNRCAGDTINEMVRNSSINKILYFETLKEGFQYIADNIEA